MPPRYRWWTALVLAGITISPIARAADKPEKPEKADKSVRPIPAAKPASTIDDTIIPDLDLQGMKLEDVIDYLQDSVPGFKAVVIRDNDVAEEVPLIRMKLKKVSLGQVLQLLTTAYSGIEINEIPGAGGTISCLKVHAVPDARPGGSGAFGAAGVGVRVYALAEYTSTLVANRPDQPKDKAAAAKDALSQVLSLIKATLAQVGGTGATVLQVHEETQTLIFKGNVDQQNALEEV